MIKFFKIITSILFSLFFILGIMTSIVIVFGPKLDTFLGNILFLLIVFNLLMLYYVNWAIWTKGKKKKNYNDFCSLCYNYSNECFYRI